MKGRLIEALAMEVPVVSTSVGVQGLEVAREFIAVADSAEAFADAIVRANRDLDALQRLARAGARFVQSTLSEQAMVAAFAQDMPELR